MSDLNAVYTERAHLTAALSKLFPASLEDHIPAEGEAWDPDWTTVLIVDLPTGQVSWHIGRHDLHLFAHLKRGEGRVWDGHTTPEKYGRLDALASAPASQRGGAGVWVDVQERLPEFGVDVYVVETGCTRVLLGHLCDWGFDDDTGESISGFEDRFGEPLEVRYWMPIPALPADAEAQP